MFFQHQSSRVRLTTSRPPFAAGLGIGVVLAALFLAMPASAESFFPARYRVGQSISKFDGVHQYALAWHGRSVALLRANRMEFAAGALTSPNKDSLFASYGPVWRMPSRWMPVARDRLFVEFGFSPTWITNPYVVGRDLGGHLHFTSSLSLAMALDERRSLILALRIQHTSNGGLNADNPGLDMAALGFVYSPGG